MNFDIELIKKCVALDKKNMSDNYLDGNGNRIDWDKLEETIARAVQSGAILRLIIEQEELKGYFLFRTQEDGAFVLSIQVERPGDNPFILKKLLKMSYLELKNASFDWIYTSADKNNKKSISLHNKLGFDLMGEKETSFSFKISRQLLLEKLRPFL